MSGHAPPVAAVVLAGGSGTRLGLGGGQNKVYLEVGGRPLLAWSVQTLDAHPQIVSILVVARSGDEQALAGTLESLAPTTPLQVVVGGPTRSASERAAFEALGPSVRDGTIEVIVVHDGARPFVSSAMLDRVITEATAHGAAIPGLAMHEPLFQLGTPPTVALKLDPAPLRRVQTPQAFRAGPLLDAYDRAGAAGFEGVDTAEVVARFADLHARVVPGDPDNLKVTTPADVIRARSIAERRDGR